MLDIPLHQISISGDRARDLDPGHAQALADSIQMQGLLYPVLVRPMADGGFRLVDGLQRVEAFKLLGRETIPVVMSDKVSDDEAMLDQVMANLARRMVALDFCRHLFMLKEAWLRLHPEAKPGGDHGNQHTGGKSQSLASGTDGAEIVAFDGAMAEKFDLGRSTVKEAVAIWTKLSPASRQRLHCTKLAGKKTELKALAEQKAPMQAKILDLILGEDHPGIENVAAALAFLERGRELTSVEKQFRSVDAAFGKLEDAALDMVLSSHAERVIAALRRMGRI